MTARNSECGLGAYLRSGTISYSREEGILLEFVECWGSHWIIWGSSTPAVEGFSPGYQEVLTHSQDFMTWYFRLFSQGNIGKHGKHSIHHGILRGSSFVSCCQTSSHSSFVFYSHWMVPKTPLIFWCLLGGLPRASGVGTNSQYTGHFEHHFRCFIPSWVMCTFTNPWFFLCMFLDICWWLVLDKPILQRKNMVDPGVSKWRRGGGSRHGGGVHQQFPTSNRWGLVWRTIYRNPPFFLIRWQKPHGFRLRLWQKINPLILKYPTWTQVNHLE